jgi:hypothetical protein
MIEHTGLHIMNSADATDLDTIIEPASKTRYDGLEACQHISESK